MGNHYPKDWHKWLPGNNGLYDENPSGEQAAMQEVVGNGKHYPKDWHKWLPGNNGLYDENSSGEQDAMKEVSGAEKGLVSNIIKGAVAGGKAAAKVVVRPKPFLPRNNPFYDENQ